MKIKKKQLIGLIIPLIYLLIGLFTLSDYGFTNDTIWRYYAGEAYAHQIKTGESVIDNIGDVRYYGPFADILGFLSAKLFTEKLGLMNHLSSHYLIPVLFTALLLYIVFIFSSEISGTFAGIASQLSLLLIPRFYGYSHIEMSMMPLAALFTSTIYALWKAWNTGKRRWIIVSGVLFGLTFAVRVHAVFTLAITFGWILLLSVFFRQDFSEKHKLQHKRMMYWILFPFLAFFAIYASWPWLWSGAISKLFQILAFFKTHTFRGHVLYDGSLYIAGVDLPWHYALKYIFITVPIIILAFFLIGSIFSIMDFFMKKNHHSILFLLWFLAVLAPLSLSVITIYDSVRQFLHIFPAIAVLSGIGIKKSYDFAENKLSNKLSAKKIMYAVYGILAILFIPTAFDLAAYHPYQHVYFNGLVGGIQGASGRFDLHVYGTHRNEALEWLNSNAEQGASFIGIPQDYHRTFPFYVRPDLKVVGENATYTIIGSSFAFDPFPDAEPAYTRAIKGVPVFRIYKNVDYSDKMDADYLNKNYKPRK